MRMYDIIVKKRDGKELKHEEISYFIDGYCDGAIPDYQVAALLMAVFLKGMNKREIADLTRIMAHSGDTIDLSGIEGHKVDKHSTGGVGDKTTLIVAPVVAACGVPVAKMAGRGLGYTGGTIDKLESVPGFRTSLSTGEFIENVKKIGISIAGQTTNIAPADKKLYALRDVTATVESIPLIASSIMSKKIASGADKIVLDVKTGSGALMKTMESSIELARTMVEIGESTGRTTAAYITNMDIPLGNAVGNSLEVMEAVNTLKNRGPDDLLMLSVELSARMIELAGLGDIDHCRRLTAEVIRNGEALKKFIEMIERQGGNPDIANDYSLFKKADIIYDCVSDRDGYIEWQRADNLGIASMILGAGRETKESSIDLSAGIVLEKRNGMRIDRGDIIARLYTNREERIEEAVDVLSSSYVIKDTPPLTKRLILAYLDGYDGLVGK